MMAGRTAEREAARSPAWTRPAAVSATRKTMLENYKSPISNLPVIETGGKDDRTDI